MKPARLEYVRPATLEGAVAELAQGGDDAKVLAGGQSLVPALNMRLLRPALLVDVNRVAGLDGVTTEDGALRVGATVRQAAYGCSAHPALAAVLPHVGHTVTRNRGTVCGSVAHADAAAELPLALLAAPARRSWSRSVVAARSSPTSSSSARTPPPSRPTSSLSRRCGRLAGDEGSRSTSSPSAVATSRSAWRARCARAATRSVARVGVGTVDPDPRSRSRSSEHPGESAAAQVEPWGSIDATPDYLRHLVHVLVDRVVARAREQAA